MKYGKFMTVLFKFNFKALNKLHFKNKQATT